MAIRLFELTTADGCSISPYVLRIRFALAHKGVTAEAVSVGFTDIPHIGGARGFRTVPVLDHDGAFVADSWRIAAHLEKAFEGPPLFPSPNDRRSAKVFETFFVYHMVAPLFPVLVMDIHDRCREPDRAYFRESREKRLGRSLEEVVADRDVALATVRDRMKTLRSVLGQNEWIGGAEPRYEDFIALGFFLWAGSVASVPLLAAEDAAIASWIARGRARYGSPFTDECYAGAERVAG